MIGNSESQLNTSDENVMQVNHKEIDLKNTEHGLVQTLYGALEERLASFTRCYTIMEA